MIYIIAGLVVGVLLGCAVPLVRLIWVEVSWWLERRRVYRKMDARRACFRARYGRIALNAGIDLDALLPEGGMNA